jgi:O-methyltransferase
LQKGHEPVSVALHPLTAWMDNVALAGLCSKETLWASYELAFSVVRRGIPGDLVECGVYGGANAAAMCRGMMDAYAERWRPGALPIEIKDRRVHLFDTFTGIPQAGPEDKEFLHVGHEPGLSACSVEGVQSHMAEWGLPGNLFLYHEGDFDDTVEDALNPWDVKISPERGAYIPEIALLRVDGDLYRSTAAAMKLFKNVSPGGWICVDDFDLSGCRQAIMEMYHDNGAQSAPAPIYFQRHTGGK